MRDHSTVFSKYHSLLFLLMVTIAYSRDTPPLYTLTASGLVSDFVVDEGKLYVATDEGSIDTFDLQ